MAFNSPFGKYEYVMVAFGLAQAPAYFQELMTLPRQHHNIQKNSSRAPLTHQEGIWETTVSKTLHEDEQMQLLF